MRVMPDRPPLPGLRGYLLTGNAILLIRYGPLTLLTDPDFLRPGSLAYLGNGLFSRRLTEPAAGAGDCSDRRCPLPQAESPPWPRRGQGRAPLLTSHGRAGAARRRPSS